jgi:hypothetical protein
MERQLNRMDNLCGMSRSTAHGDTSRSTAYGKQVEVLDPELQGKGYEDQMLKVLCVKLYALANATKSPNRWKGLGNSLIHFNTPTHV